MPYHHAEDIIGRECCITGRIQPAVKKRPGCPALTYKGGVYLKYNDSESFLRAVEDNASQRMRTGIGTLSEKTLHAAVKRYLEPHSGSHEVKIGRT